MTPEFCKARTEVAGLLDLEGPFLHAFEYGEPCTWCEAPKPQPIKKARFRRAQSH